MTIKTTHTICQTAFRFLPVAGHALAGFLQALFLSEFGFRKELVGKTDQLFFKGFGLHVPVRYRKLL